MTLKLPRIVPTFPIVQDNNTATMQFIQWQNKYAKEIEANAAAVDTTNETQDAALEALNTLVPKINAAYELVGPGAYAFTASATLPTDCRTAIVDTTAGAVTLTLQPVANCLADIVVKKTNAGANNVVIDPSGAETIDGAATVSFNTQYASRMIRPALGAWHLIASI